MSDRQCKLCGKEFKYPKYLREHQQRKTPCAPILEPEDLPDEVLEDPDLNKKKCRFCGRVFANYTSMRRHIRNACRIAPNARNGTEGMEVLYEHTLRKQAAEIAALKAQNAAIMTRMDELAAAQQEKELALAAAGETATREGNIIMQNSGQSVIAQDRRNQVIQINLFGGEDLSHIGRPEIRAILDSSLNAGEAQKSASAAVLQTALLTYSDPDHPENLTCYLPNKKTDDALVHGGAGWEVRPCPLVLTPMAQQSLDLLFDHQPFEDAETYETLISELRDNEKRYASGEALRPVLVRNKSLLARALESLPMAGED